MPFKKMIEFAGYMTLDRSRSTGDAVRHMLSALPHESSAAPLALREKGPISIGQFTWRTTDLQINNKTPNIHYTKDLLIAADIRIDNVPVLSQALGIHEESLSDLELVNAAYLKWGVHFVEHIVGVFAIVIWDARIAKLYLFGDQIGIRGIYYYKGQDFLAFSTDMVALQRAPGVPWKEDEEELVKYLIMHEEINKDYQTIFKDVYLLTQGHYLCVTSSGSSQLVKYYDLDEAAQKHQYDTDEEWFAVFRKYMIRAVQRRITNVSKVGCELSGGLDSGSISSIAGLIKRQDQDIQAYHIVQNDPLADERIYAYTISDKYNIPITELKAINFINAAERLTPMLGYPLPCIHYGTSIPIWEQLQKDGVTVCLSGEDGDNTVSRGDLYPQELLLKKQFGTFKSSINSLHCGKNSLQLHHPDIRWRQKSKYISYNLSQSLKLYNKRDKEYWQQLVLSLTNYPILTALAIIRDIKNKMFGRYRRFQFRPKQIHNVNIHKEKVYKSERSKQIALITRKSNGYYFKHDVDLAKRYGIEMRFPFMDRPLIELCIAMPSIYKWCEGLGRGPIRVGLSNILPMSIRSRIGKSNFNDHLVNDISRYGPYYFDQINPQWIDLMRPLINYKDLITFSHQGSRKIKSGFISNYARIINYLIYKNNKLIEKGIHKTSDKKIGICN